MSTQDTKTRKAHRQGELLFVPLNKNDIQTVASDNNGVKFHQWHELDTDVLREVETTGHKHQVLSKTDDAVSIMAPARSFMNGLSGMNFIGTEDRLLVSRQPVRVVHPEHKSLRLPAGIFLVVIQREYDEVRARRVMD